MKKILFLSIFLLNLLTSVSNIDMGNQMLAQNMGSEVTYYPCKTFDPTTGDDVWHFSTSPCNNELKEVCVTACPYCRYSMPCDNFSWHSCPGKYNAEHSGNDNYPSYPTYPPSTGGGGGSTSGGGGGGSAYHDNKPEEPKSQRYSDDYDLELRESFGHNIRSVDFQRDLKRLQASSIGIVQNPSTCSAASIEKILLDLNPTQFEQLATELYHCGKSSIGDLKCPDCMREYRSNQLVPNTNYYDEKNGSHVVDLLIQSALINSMNTVSKYDPIKDNGKFTDMGWQAPSAVEGMLKKLFGEQNVTATPVPYAEYMSSIDYDKNYVIVLCNYNNSSNNYNLDGAAWNLHYAILNSFECKENDYHGSIANYWSWGANHVSTKNNQFLYVFVIKKQ